MRSIARMTLATLMMVTVAMLPGTASATTGTLFITTDTVLTEDHIGSIAIDADNVTLNCAGHSITGPGDGHGIAVFSHARVTITNCVVTGWEQGIPVVDSEGVVLVRNRASGNPGNGFYILRSADTRLADNVAAGNGAQGVHIDASQATRLEGNTFAGNASWGIVLTGTTGTLATGNVSRGNAAGLGLANSSDNIFSSNVFGESWESYGVVLDGSSSNTFFHNQVELNPAQGFWLEDSSENVIAANTVTSNEADGVVLIASSSNEITLNRVMRNQASGINVGQGSSLNEIHRNLACRNLDGDAHDDGTGTGNNWTANRFCTSSI
jgi:parallel beta-helix repeat protein